jgi:hypothetical protein
VACATGRSLKTCQSDGSDWVITACAENEKCDDGECVLNDEGSCNPGVSLCSSESGGYRCAADGSHYEPFGCPPDAPCKGFKCRGTACTPGETKCADPAQLYEDQDFIAPQIFASNQMFKCNDAGSGWELVPCAADEYCKYDSLSDAEAQLYQSAFLSWYNQEGSKPELVLSPDVYMQASCVKPACYEAFGPTGQSVCGDPENPSAEKVGSYSQCEGLLPFSVPHWVPYLCDAPTTCNPLHEGAAECSIDCIPGESVCEAAIGGDNDGIIVCNANGEWDPAQDCNTGGEKAQACYTTYPENGGARQAKCVDPVCAYVWDAFGSFKDEFGLCEGDQLRACDEDGQIVDANDATDCDVGVCRSWTTIENNAVGRCQSECEDGDTVCLDADTDAEEQYGGALAASPFYLECQNGAWNLEVHSCADDALCFGTRTSSTATTGNSVICGGECVPGWRQCATDLESGTTGVTTCTAEGVWGPRVDCEVGSCVADDPGVDGNGFTSLDAECRFACVPGASQCGFDQELASATVATCSDDGVYGDAETCPAATDDCDVNVGCYECVGQNLAAARSTTVETQCGLDGSILTCGANNRWPTQGTSCGTGMVCGTSFGRAHCVTAPPAPDAGAVADAGRDAGDAGGSDGGDPSDAASGVSDASLDASDAN